MCTLYGKRNANLLLQNVDLPNYHLFHIFQTRACKNKSFTFNYYLTATTTNWCMKENSQTETAFKMYCVIYSLNWIVETKMIKIIL